MIDLLFLQVFQEIKQEKANKIAWAKKKNKTGRIGLNIINNFEKNEQ
jgi:hypothetical protein